MPNVRIALAISNRHPHLIRAEASWGGDSPPGILAMTDDPSPPAKAAPSPSGKPLTPAAKRALAEAEARRQAAEANAAPRAKEFQGPKGPEPTRYGDWERKGIASDF
jgi:hypothetical protein